MNRRKICVVTGSRADYGILYRLMCGVREDSELQLQVVVTGMHLALEFGSTWQVVEEDGFAIDARVEMLLSSDTAVGVAKSIGLGVIGMADVLERLNPDIMVVLGDRFEIFAAVQAALIARIPVAHISGGDVTEGAFDEAIRHSITKMSHLHFVTNPLSAQRVRQLGEDPARVYLVGSPAIDQIKQLSLMSREKLAAELGFRFRDQNLLVTFHPVTLEKQTAEEQLAELLAALDILGPEVGIIFTRSNADTGGRAINRLIDDFVATHSNAAVFASLGQLRYLSAIAHVDAVVGNSSSGICEVPSLRKPTVNIGDRQKGRLQAASIINCSTTAAEIRQAIDAAFLMDCSDVVNPYGDGEASTAILKILKSVPEPGRLVLKRFFAMGE